MTAPPVQVPAASPVGPAGDRPSIGLDPNAVIQELCTDPMGRALWERAQWRVAADVLQRRVIELEAQRSPAATSPAPAP